MISFKYLTAILKPDLYDCKDNIKKSLFLSNEEISFLSDNHCLVSIQPDTNGKYLVEFDRENLLALCS